MRMKSVLALTAVSAATFLASVAYAADAKPAKQTASKAMTQKVQANAQTQVKAETAAPAQTEQAAVKSNAVKKGHKKHAHHKKHKKHHHGHRHHHGHHHNHFHFFEMEEEIPSWNFLAGGSLGYAFQSDYLTNQTTISSAVPFPEIFPAFKVVEQGVMMSLLAGWQWHCERWMYGIEGNVDFNSYERDRQFAYSNVAPSQNYTGTVLYDRGDIYAITGRVGYFVTPFFMPYVRLGGQVSRDEVSFQIIATTPLGLFTDFASRKKDVYGVVAGVGAEFPTYIGSSTIRFEYNYTRTDKIVLRDNVTPLIANYSFSNTDSHIGKIAWVWNFM